MHIFINIHGMKGLVVSYSNHRELFESSLLATLMVKGIDLSDMPVVTRIPHALRALTGELQTYADEHSPMK